jgi:hypothetical protein
MARGISLVAVVLLLLLWNEVECLSSTTTPSIITPPRIRALRQVSSEPLAFTIDDFCDASTCAALALEEGEEQHHNQQQDAARLHFATLVAGELFAGQWGKQDGLRQSFSKSSDRNNNNNNNGGQCAEGLHVDTNNGSPFRSVTAILYLNDLPEECGAATVFPLAGANANDPRLRASQRLLQEEIYHTRGSAYTAEAVKSNDLENTDGTASTTTTTTTNDDIQRLTLQQEEDAALLESVMASTPADDTSATGLHIQPQAGRLLVFFSRLENGEIDPRSWHGGERLKPLSVSSSSSEVIEKKIVTLFKEVSYGTIPEHPLGSDDDASFEKYLSPQISEQRRFLIALAESHAPFFQQ